MKTTPVPSATTKSPGVTVTSPTVIGTPVATSTMRPRAVLGSGGAGKDREVVFARLVDIAGGAVDDDARDLTQLGAERQVAAPAGGVNAGSLLHHDDVAWLR